MQNNFKRTRIACYTGYITQAIVVNLAPLLFVIFQDTFNVSLGFIALITLITFLVQIVIDLAAVKFVEKVTYRFLAVSSQLTSAVGLILLAILPGIMSPELGILIAVLVYSPGSGLAEVVLSPLVEGLPSDDNSGGSAMTLMHSFYSWGQAGVILLTTVLLKFLGRSLWWVIPLIWALIPIYNTLCFLKVPMVEMNAHDENHGVGGMLKEPIFVIAFVLMICAGASEQAMAQWASMFAERGLGVTKVVGDILGPCLFAVMMGLGRTAHGLFGARINMEKLLLSLAAFTTVCYAVCVFAPFPFMSLLACGFSGVGVSVMWPGMLVLCAEKFPGGGASMFAMLALGGDIGCSLGPYIAGAASDTVIELSGEVQMVADAAVRFGLDAEQLGLRVGFLAAAIFPVLMLCGVTLLRKKGSREKH